MNISDMQVKPLPVGMPFSDGSPPRPRVVHFTGTLAEGGSERQALQLADGMRRSGRFEVEFATLDPNGALRQEAESLGFPDIPSYPLRSFYDWNMMVQLRGCAARLRSSRIALIHTHDFYSNVFGMLAARLAGVPVRVASRRELGGMRTAAQKWVERRCYGLAQRVVANSGAVRDQLIREGVPERKINVIHNGLDSARLAIPNGCSRHDMLSSLGLPPDEVSRYISIVANLRHDVKDHPTFLRAARRISQREPRARFVIAGEGELLEPMRALAARLEIERQVVFLGRCSKVAQLLAISEVCVLSSRYEGFSNSILEYMAAARPVVATDVGGAREAMVNRETGFLVSAGDDAAMGERILWLLQNGAAAKTMGKNGRRRIEERFSSRVQLEATEAFYSQLLRCRIPQAVKN
jgi:glycosyltransferase involved in cell wall biosynthesis